MKKNPETSLLDNGDILLSPFTATEEAVISVLAYYAIFRHPLKINEVSQRLNTKSVSVLETTASISNLVQAGIIDELDGYYMLKGSQEWVSQRKSGEKNAKKLIKVARRMSKLVYWFPFVRGVFISGSLSKGSVPEDADIDYFIITKRNRLWIARTLLVMFKRAFLLGSKKYFCVNYFVDEDHLEIPDKNIFTATEVSTVIPMRGSEYCKAFMAKNTWYRNFYPNIELSDIRDSQPGFLKRFSKTILEPLFYHSMAEKLDRYFMKKTYSRWTNMYGQGYSDKEFELAFRTHRGTSKNHDKNFQKRVLNKVQENINLATGSVKAESIHG